LSAHCLIAAVDRPLQCPRTFSRSFEPTPTFVPIFFVSLRQHFSQSSRRLVATSPCAMEPWVTHTRISCEAGWLPGTPCGLGHLQLAQFGVGIRGIPHLPKSGRYGAPGVPLRGGSFDRKLVEELRFAWVRYAPSGFVRLRSEVVTFSIAHEICGWKARKNICQQASPRSFDSAPETFCYAIDLRSASLRMTALWWVENVRLGVQKTQKDQKVTGSQDDVFVVSGRCKNQLLRGLPLKKA
jgi:hypothetical protein